jgi:predicted nucleic acid-binding protein
VKWFFDSSVLVATFVPGHEHHERSIAVFTAANRHSGCSAAHCLAETYATLTRLPGTYRASAEQAITCVETIKDRLALVHLESEEYLAAIRQAAESSIVGGLLYDALLGACALKAKANVIYTWNVGHFTLLGDEIARKVRTP